MATIATYASHTGKAINFFFNTKNIMFAIGRQTPWGERSDEVSSSTLIDDNHPPYPSLDTTEIEEIIGYKPYNNMYFVIPDETSPDPIVDGVHWRKISVNANLPKNPLDYTDEQKSLLINEVKSQKARWIYLDFQLDPTDFPNYQYRQIGLYSDLKIDSTTGATSSLKIFNANMIVPGSGILEVVQNRSPITRSDDQRELIAVVLEF